MFETVAIMRNARSLGWKWTDTLHKSTYVCNRFRWLGLL